MGLFQRFCGRDPALPASAPEPGGCRSPRRASECGSPGCPRSSAPFVTEPFLSACTWCASGPGWRRERTARARGSWLAWHAHRLSWLRGGVFICQLGRPLTTAATARAVTLPASALAPRLSSRSGVGSGWAFPVRVSARLLPTCRPSPDGSLLPSSALAQKWARLHCPLHRAGQPASTLFTARKLPGSHFHCISSSPSLRR